MEFGGRTTVRKMRFDVHVDACLIVWRVVAELEFDVSVFKMRVTDLEDGHGCRLDVTFVASDGEAGIFPAIERCAAGEAVVASEELVGLGRGRGVAERVVVAGAFFVHCNRSVERSLVKIYRQYEP